MSRSRAGWVYVIKSEGLPGCVKVGRTNRGTDVRFRELRRDYGTSHPWVVHSKHMVSDCVAVETEAHRILHWCRVPKSELFECDPATAQKAVLRAAVIVLGRPWYLRVWYWIVLPRPKRALNAGGGRGSYRRQTNWRLSLLAVAILMGAAVVRYKPDLPDWMPEPVLRTARLIESW